MLHKCCTIRENVCAFFFDYATIDVNDVIIDNSTDPIGFIKIISALYEGLIKNENDHTL